jgi:hypothetical protein
MFPSRLYRLAIGHAADLGAPRNTDFYGGVTRQQSTKRGILPRKASD